MLLGEYFKISYLNQLSAELGYLYILLMDLSITTERMF